MNRGTIRIEFWLLILCGGLATHNLHAQFMGGGMGRPGMGGGMGGGHWFGGDSSKYFLEFNRIIAALGENTKLY